MLIQYFLSLQSFVPSESSLESLSISITTCISLYGAIEYITALAISTEIGDINKLL